VNIAARLEQLNKLHGTSIMVSNSTRAMASMAGYDFQPLGEAKIRGYKDGQTVFALSTSSTSTS